MPQDVINAAFLNAVVPVPTTAQPGFISIHWTFKTTDPKKGPVTKIADQAFDNIASAINFAQYMVLQKVDLYFALGLQAMATRGRTRKGRPKFIAHRVIGNILTYKSIWIDLDLKGLFRDTAHAAQVFGEWRRKVGLPDPSYVVCSGSGGFHIYYTFPVPISAERWEKLAYALAEAIRREGLPMGAEDLKNTIMPTMILRIPDTWNYKHDPPRPVFLIPSAHTEYPVEQIEQILQPYLVSYAPRVTTPSSTGWQLPPGSKPAAAFGGVSLPGRLDAGIDETHYVPTIEEVKDVCPFIREVHNAAGQDRSEKEWFESLKVAYYCKDGREVAHELSWGWDTPRGSYSEADVDDKFDSIEASHANQKIGWPKCHEIDQNSGAMECKACPHRTEGKSPLNFAKPLVAAAVTAAAPHQPAPVITQVIGSTTWKATKYGYLPLPYYHDNEGRVCVDIAADKDDPTKTSRMLVHPLPMYDFWPQEKSDGGEGHYALNFRCEVNKIGKAIDMQIKYVEWGDMRRFITALSEQGMASASPNTWKGVHTFMTSFAEQLRASKTRVFQAQRPGWIMEGGKREGFAYDRTAYANGKGDMPIVPADPVLGSGYSTVGDAAVEAAARDMLAAMRRPDLDAMVGASAGTPLLALTGELGFVQSIVADTGYQKSAGMKVCQGLWGDTVGQMGGILDTALSINKKLGILNNIPAVIDDIRHQDQAKQMFNNYLGSSQGKSRQRLTRGADFAEVKTWATSILIATNTSLHDFIEEHDETSLATYSRVFEFHAMKPTPGGVMIDRPTATRILAGLQYNHGHAGKALAQFYGHNVAQVDTETNRTIEAINNALKATDAERFYVITIGCDLQGLKYLKQLGLYDSDIDAACQFLIETFHRLRDMRGRSRSDMSQSGNVEAFLSGYMNANNHQLLVTKEMWLQPTRPPQTFRAVVLGNATNDFRGGLTMHAAKDQQIVRLSYRAFIAWLKREYPSIPRGTILKMMSGKVPFTIRKNATLGVGTHHVAATRQDVIELDLSKMPGFFTFPD